MAGMSYETSGADSGPALLSRTVEHCRVRGAGFNGLALRWGTPYAYWGDAAGNLFSGPAGTVLIPVVARRPSFL